jgi:hypothetical protein
VRPHPSLNYMIPEEFRKKWIKKEIGRKKHVEFLE